MDKKLTMLMILDGFGINENEKGNAVKLANTPNIDKLMKTCPTTQIYTKITNYKIGRDMDAFSVRSDREFKMA